jgi:hypothetical protein
MTFPHGRQLFSGLKANFGNADFPSSKTKGHQGLFYDGRSGFSMVRCCAAFRWRNRTPARWLWAVIGREVEAVFFGDRLRQYDVAVGLQGTEVEAGLTLKRDHFGKVRDIVGTV